MNVKYNVVSTLFAAVIACGNVGATDFCGTCTDGSIGQFEFKNAATSHAYGSATSTVEGGGGYSVEANYGRRGDALSTMSFSGGMGYSAEGVGKTYGAGQQIGVGKWNYIGWGKDE